MAILTQAPKGTKDVIPAEVHKWHYIEKIMRETAAHFGFGEIRFPTFEHTELFERGVGDTTDIVQKEMYTFTDKGGRSITLRPEGTASVVRSFIENGIIAQAMPFKCYYIAPNFRYEAPQSGRLREHHQFGVEYFGSQSPCADAEVIGIGAAMLGRIGLTGLRAHINSIGCPVCRPVYLDVLQTFLSRHESELCETCRGRMTRNPMRVLDCKSSACKAVTASAPRSLEYLCDECAVHFDGLRAYLTEMGIEYIVDRDIVRGLDYYTKTVFEFIAENIGAQSTVLAGGRYDGLVATLGGTPVPGLGFGSGIERLLLALEASGVAIEKDNKTDVFIALAGAEGDMAAHKLVHGLRCAGVIAERDTLSRSLKAQMKYADKIGARYCIVIGSDELACGKAEIRGMADGTKTGIGLSVSEITNFLSKG